MSTITTDYLHFCYRNQKIKGNNDNENAIFYGPPSSCKDLGKLGYTLNGYYFVRNKNIEVGSLTEKKMEVILCRFQFPSENTGRQ